MPLVFLLFGVGLGAFIVGARSGSGSPREAGSLRARAIEAQRAAARATEEARDLAARWNDQGDRG